VNPFPATDRLLHSSSINPSSSSPSSPPQLQQVHPPYYPPTPPSSPSTLGLVGALTTATMIGANWCFLHYPLTPLSFADPPTSFLASALGLTILLLRENISYTIRSEIVQILTTKTNIKTTKQHKTPHTEKRRKREQRRKLNE